MSRIDQKSLIRIDAWWRVANYLSVGQIYLIDNPLLHKALKDEDIKIRLSGVSSDLRLVIKAAEEGSRRAILAYDRFRLSVRGAMGAATAVLEGVDAIVFTGGIGENSEKVRRDTSRALSYLGVVWDEDKNVRKKKLI